MPQTMSKQTEEHATQGEAPEDILEEVNQNLDETDAAEEEPIRIDTGLLEQITKLQDEVKTSQERYLRTIADMENLRKRAARDKEEIRRRAASSLIEDLLPAFDNLELGLQEAKKHDEAKGIVQGFEVVVGQLAQILAQHGLERIEPNVGDAFDHNLHEAMAQQASEEIEDHHVLKMIRVGYNLNERLLRPASVVVSSGAEGAE